jgi:hypothetical protein
MLEIEVPDIDPERLLAECELTVDADLIEALAPLERRIIVAAQATDGPPPVVGDDRS